MPVSVALYCDSKSLEYKAKFDRRESSSSEHKTPAKKQTNNN